MRRILACGGQQLRLPALTSYLLGLVGKPRPRVLFLPTASGDGAYYLTTFRQAFDGIECEAAHLALFDRTVADVDAFIRAQDAVIVGGGNTANMLAIWRVHGVDRALRAAYEAGTVVTGWSAGCICWFEDGITDSFTPELGPLRDGLGWLRGSACPHYDSQERRRPVYAREIAAGMPAGIALEDGVAALYEDERLVEIVTAREGGRAFAVDAAGEHPLAVRSIARSREEVAAEIVALAEVDQRMRRAAAEEGARWDPTVDQRSTERMRGIITEIGWPTRSRVGEAAEHQAWLLVQHADADRAFQKECFELMRAAPPGEVCPKHLAYLEDRIRTGEGRPQLYGTQLRAAKDGGWEPIPLEDPEHVDERRAAVGLGPLREYVAGARSAR